MRKLSHDLIRIFSIQIIIVLVLAGLVVLGYLYRKPLLITYHRMGQRSALKAMRRTERQHGRFNRHSDRLRDHTKALIRLGYLEERRFQPKFLTSRSPQTQVMIEEFRRIYPRSSYEIGWGKMLTITDRPERMPTWESLIQKYDVPPTDSNQPAASKDLPEADE
jgi:hypothetical protein